MPTPISRSLPLALSLLAAPAAVCTAGPAPYSQAVTGGAELSQFIRAAQSTRVDVIGIGDSNQIYGGHGWDHGWILALDERFGTYATSLLSLGENIGNSANAGVGFRIIATSSQGFFQYAGADPAFDDFLTPDIGMRPLNYVRVPAGESATLQNHGLSVPANGIITAAEPLRYHLTHATFQDGSAGSFRPIIRLGAPPYSVVYESEPISLSGSDAIATTTFDFAGAPPGLPIQVMLGRFNSALNGPFIGYTIRAEREAVTSGASFSSLYAYGGQSARDMAEAFQQSSDTYLIEYFSQIRSLQGAEKFVMIRINTGLNDRSETQPPLGGSGLAPNSPEAYAIHLNMIIERIRSVWTAAGWDDSELYFLLAPSHPVDDPDQQLLLSYREKAREVAAGFDRCAVVDFTELTNEAEMLASGWYQLNGTDRNHLTQPAYEALALRELDALLSYSACPDLDGNGAVDLDDLNAVLGAFGSASPSADATGDGVVDLDDLNAVLQAFGSTCSGSSHD